MAVLRSRLSGVCASPSLRAATPLPCRFATYVNFEGRPQSTKVSCAAHMPLRGCASQAISLLTCSASDPLAMLTPPLCLAVPLADGGAQRRRRTG